MKATVHMDFMQNTVCFAAGKCVTHNGMLCFTTIYALNQWFPLGKCVILSKIKLNSLLIEVLRLTFCDARYCLGKTLLR